MKYIIALLLVISPLTDIDRIAKVNKLKKEAKKAYTTGDFQQAIDKYTYLLDSMDVKDPNINLNLANAYYHTQDTTNALNTYQSLIKTDDKIIKSVAHQQLGVMNNKEKKFDEALKHFKNAIKANPANDEARYNYEMLKKMLEEQDQDKKDDQKKQDQKNQDQKNKDQQKQDQKQKNDQQNQEKQDQEKENQEKDKQDQKKKNEQEKEGEEGEQNEDKPTDEQKKQDEQQKKPQEGEESKEKDGKQEEMNSLSEKLKDMKISEEKAKMILEALKNNEIQYIQQNKRKATKRKDPGKPDW